MSPPVRCWVLALLLLGIGSIHARHALAMEYGDQVGLMTVAASSTTVGYSAYLAQQGIYGPLALGLAGWGIVYWNMAQALGDARTAPDYFAQTNALSVASDLSRGGGPWLSAYLALTDGDPRPSVPLIRTLQEFSLPALEAGAQEFALALRAGRIHHPGTPLDRFPAE